MHLNTFPYRSVSSLNRSIAVSGPKGRSETSNFRDLPPPKIQRLKIATPSERNDRQSDR